MIETFRSKSFPKESLIDTQWIPHPSVQNLQLRLTLEFL